jgi:DNA mismatch endonuclease (patch repair protein)
MTDVLTPAQRSRCMSHIHSCDTGPEMVVRRLVHGMGYRYRLHAKELPGKPDLVLPRHRKVIFVHGCFWHSHRCRYGQVVPQTRREFWENKRQATVTRDRRNLRELRKQGWWVLVIWECWTKDALVLRKRLSEFLESSD